MRGAFATGSVLLAGSLAAVGLATPASAAEPRPAPKLRSDHLRLGTSVRDAVVAASVAISSAAQAVVSPAPTRYRVAPGDTVSSIAGAYGLSTASVLALNGLGWSSIIFPGQELTLSSSGTVAPVQTPTRTEPSGRYTIVSGDTISGIAERHGISTISVLTANGLGWSSLIYPGQTLAIPGFIGSDSPSADDFVPVASSTPLPDPVVAPVVEAPASVEPAPVPVPAPATSTYLIVSGDTIGAIATRFGVTTQALLDANGLDWSSVIYAGQTVVIPAVGAASPASSSSTMNDEMRANATIIVQVGRDLGVPDYGIAIALATAMQESSLRNLSWGDRDSVGLFQQRPSTGWGSVDQLMDPAYAARLFYGGPSNPNRGYTRGLLDIAGWESLSLSAAAQRVQISAFPDAYAKWESSAWQWLAELS
ncbi:MAG: LysM peptidoglycan-binding domain-containing protein [Salinibacterium sp.]|nr:LysM peptidoglycan-binding domain-containing protein [Salinibacterium sp.]